MPTSRVENYFAPCSLDNILFSLTVRPILKVLTDLSEVIYHSMSDFICKGVLFLGTNDDRGCKVRCREEYSTCFLSWSVLYFEPCMVFEWYCTLILISQFDIVFGHKGHSY